MEQSTTKVTSPDRTTLRYKLHWHVIFTHFPVAFFTGSFGFMILHFFTRTSCFELAAYLALIAILGQRTAELHLALIAGALSIIPTAISGWFTWKGRYKGGRGRIFLYKIRISFVMIGISWFLVAYRATFSVEFLDIFHNIWHLLYFVGILVLVAGAIAEGYYGGRLNHR